MAVEPGRARYSSIHYYRKPGPLIKLYRPTRIAYLAKIAYEKYWLHSWFGLLVFYFL